MKLSDEMKQSRIDLPIFSDSYNSGFKTALEIFIPKVEALEKEKDEITMALINTTKRICDLMDKHSCGDLEKYLMPVFFENKELIEKAGKKWSEINENI